MNNNVSHYYCQALLFFVYASNDGQMRQPEAGGAIRTIPGLPIPAEDLEFCPHFIETDQEFGRPLYVVQEDREPFVMGVMIVRDENSSRAGK